MVKLVMIFAFCVLSLIGCAQVKETTRGIIGISTKQIEEGRSHAIVKAFPMDYKTCNEAVTKILKKINAYTYTVDRKKKLIAIYITESDTTPVGIFFKEIDSANTQIEVASPSSYGKEFISGKLFTGLDKVLNPDKEEGQADDKKTEQSK